MAAYSLGWKVEPTSPLAYAEDDVWFIREGGVNTNIAQNNNFGSLTKKEIAQKLLEDIDRIVKNEERDTFSDWVEETIDLHMFDEVQPVMPAEELKSGMECAEDVNTSVKKADLTPPYSPGDISSDSCIILDYDTLNPVKIPDESSPDCTYQTVLSLVLSSNNNVVVAQNLSDESTFCAENRPLSNTHFLTAPPTPVPDLEKEMAVVDEVVRKTAQSLENNIEVWEFEISSPQISSSESLQSFEVSVESDDSEWVPPGKRKYTSPRKKSKPYERPKSQEDRLLRKKEQNKNAATRYRQKKKAEISEIHRQEKLLEQRRGKLKQRLADIQMEIKYLKSLMRDLFLDKNS